MRFLLINNIQNARQSLRSSRIRSALTMLGVAIGVASITVILSLSIGANKIISDQIDSLAGNIIVIRPGAPSNPMDNITRIQSNQNYATSTLTEPDITYVKNTAHIESAAPLMVLSGAIKADSTAPINSQVVATTEHLADISGLEIRDGQFLDDKTSQNTAVIGVQLSINIFGTESSIGRKLIIRGQPFTVIGVLKRTSKPINYNSIDFDNAAIIHFEMGKQLNQGIAQIQQINVKADSADNIAQAAAAITNALRTSHGNENDFSVLTGNQISQPTNQIFYALAGAMGVIAVISLTIGGIGIMNIMLVTVAERTREIGIRKALGASNTDISWQFLIESLVISLGGGIIGYVLGYIIAFNTSRLLTFEPVINWQISVVALGVSLFIGITFGLYPAARAARKDPIESLHQHH